MSHSQPGGSSNTLNRSDNNHRETDNNACLAVLVEQLWLRRWPLFGFLQDLICRFLANDFHSQLVPSNKYCSVEVKKALCHDETDGGTDSLGLVDKALTPFSFNLLGRLWFECEGTFQEALTVIVPHVESYSVHKFCQSHGKIQIHARHLI